MDLAILWPNFLTPLGFPFSSFFVSSRRSSGDEKKARGQVRSGHGLIGEYRICTRNGRYRWIKSDLR